MPMAKQPFGTRRLPRVSRNERAVDPQTGKPEKPVEYNIVLPTDAGDKVIGFVQRVPYGGRGSRDHWRPWPASWAGPDLPDVITDDAAYIKAIEVLVEAWHASEPGTQMTPEAAAQAPPSPAEQAAAGGDLYDNPVQPTPRPAEPEYPPEPDLGDVRDSRDTSGGSTEAEAQELADSGQAVLARPEEPDSDTQPDPYIDVMADAHDAEFEPERSSADDYAAQGDVAGTAESDAMWKDSPVSWEGETPAGEPIKVIDTGEMPPPRTPGVVPPAPVSEDQFEWQDAPAQAGPPLPPPPPPPVPPLQVGPPPPAVVSDLSWLAAPAVPKDDDQEPPDPFSDPRVTPFA